jgi:hypothetical protein
MSLKFDSKRTPPMTINAKSLLDMAPVIATLPTHSQALSMRKRIYRLGARELGWKIRVNGCELSLEKDGAVSVRTPEGERS